MPPRIGPKRPIRVFLQQWREHKGMTQQDLGNRIEPPVDKGTVSRWESAGPGKLSLGVIAAYAEALDMHPAELYRPPDNRPNLDAMAAGLEKDEVEKLAGDIEFLRRRHAS